MTGALVRAGTSKRASRPATLRDGSVATIRATTPGDAERLAAFYEGLSEESRLLRFLGAGIDAGRAARELARQAGVGLMAFAGDRLVGHGCLVPTGAGCAEVAFAIADSDQGHGVATILLERLVEEAPRLGIDTLTAEVDPENHRMIRVFEEAGLPVTVHLAEGVLEVRMAAAVSDAGRVRIAARHRAATVAGMAHVLAPRAVAVIGGSTRPESVGAQVIGNILAGGYRGALHLVHRRESELCGRPTVHSVAELPAGVDLAILAVPADQVVGVARECAAAGVHALLVLSAGFGETGATGRRRQDELVAVCRAAGMRLVGPNCLGVVSTDPEVSLHATFAPQRVGPGTIALGSQSGGVGIVAMDAAQRRGLGLAAFVSLGDRADVSSNDLLRAWAADDRVRAIALYLESFGNPRWFAGIAREVAADKPIVAVKAGRSRAGLRAAASHTGALVEGADGLADVLLADAGVTRVDTVAELLDVSAVLADGRVGPAPRVAVLTNAGGAGIACSDALEAEGLKLARLRAATRDRIREARPVAAVGNPIDLVAGATAEHFAAAFAALTDDPGVDVVIALHVDLAGEDGGALGAVARAAKGARVPVIGVPLAQGQPRGLGGRIVLVDAPEAAARALGHAARSARRTRRRRDRPQRPARVDRAAGAAVVAEALAAGEEWLSPERAGRLAEAYALPVAASRVVPTPDAVAAAAAELGSGGAAAFAVKGVAPGVVHKTDAGAVALGLKGPEAARAAAVDLDARLRASGHPPTGFLVQRMAGDGVELLIGALNHPAFGPLVACGAGGTLAELLQDTDMRLAPVTRRDAYDLLAGLRVHRLLAGWRGAPRCDVSAVTDAIWRLSTLIDDRPEIAEAEINPLIVTPDGAVGVDLRVRLG